jgi:hypothetical protein
MSGRSAQPSYANLLRRLRQVQPMVYPAAAAAPLYHTRNLLFCHSQIWLHFIMPSRVYDWWDRLCL